MQPRGSAVQWWKHPALEHAGKSIVYPDASMSVRLLPFSFSFLFFFSSRLFVVMITSILFTCLIPHKTLAKMESGSGVSTLSVVVAVERAII